MPTGKEMGTRLLWDSGMHFGDGNTSVPCSLDATARYDYRLPTSVSPHPLVHSSDLDLTSEPASTMSIYCP